MVKGITDVATNKSKSIVVDKKLIDGSGSDDKGKMWIPAVIGLQVKLIIYFFSFYCPKHAGHSKFWGWIRLSLIFGISVD